MSEMGVLDLSGGFAAGPQARTAAMRSSRNWMAQFRNNPGLVRAAAAMSFDRCRFGNRFPLVFANTMFRNRQQTAYSDPLIAHWTGINPQVGASGVPGGVRTRNTPQSMARTQGWMPGAGVEADTRARMGVRAKIMGPGQNL